MRVLMLMAISCLLLFSVGCRKGAAPQNISATTTTASSTLKTVDVRKAIIRACAARGWSAREISPGLIEARLVVRGKHTVVVDIPFTAQNYSITYKNSTNMEYKPKSDGSYTIHPNYNKWVNTLHADIDVQLTLADQ